MSRDLAHAAGFALVAATYLGFFAALISTQSDDHPCLAAIDAGLVAPATWAMTDATPDTMPLNAGHVVREGR